MSYDKNSNAQFPTLKPPTSVSTSKPQTPNLSNKRDYVAPQLPTLSPVTKPHSTIVPQNRVSSTQPSAKRDYVAPQYPILKPPSSTNNANLGTTPKTSTNPKRDYVAPTFTTPKPFQNNGREPQGKIKDLINFYDGKSNQGSTVLPKAPSYSSILKGTSQPVTPSPGLSLSTKPNFSSIASGHKESKPITPTSSTKPVPSGGNLPSTILNNNKNNQGINTPSDAELQLMSEELLKKDVNNAAKFVTINYQEKTSSFSKEDKAPQP